MFTRILCIEDFFAGVGVSNIKAKYGINSERSIRRWLVEWGNDVYDEALAWNVEKQKNTYRMKGGGRKLEDPDLERHLLHFMNQLHADRLQLLNPLLVLEALFQRPNFKGGPDSPGWKAKVANYLQAFNFVWRSPTTIGQKLPQGWMGKWYLCSMFYYVKTEGIPLHLSFNGDETKFLKNFVSSKQLAIKGSKEVPCATEGQEKDGVSCFLYTDGNGVHQDPFFFIPGGTAPNRPQLAQGVKHQRGTIRDKLDRAVAAGTLDPRHKFWVNESGVMDTEATMYLIDCHGNTKARDESGKFVLSSLLIDSHKPHKTDLVKETCDPKGQYG